MLGSAVCFTVGSTREEEEAEDVKEAEEAVLCSRSCLLPPPIDILRVLA
jgi:hypothetical protein